MTFTTQIIPYNFKSTNEFGSQFHKYQPKEEIGCYRAETGLQEYKLLQCGRCENCGTRRCLTSRDQLAKKVLTSSRKKIVLVPT